MPKYSDYNERNRNGCCAVTRCEQPLDPDDTWVNSLNNNLYCGPCKNWFYNQHDRFSTGAIQRKWTKKPKAGHSPA
jgi:hypothetical protein